MPEAGVQTCTWCNSPRGLMTVHRQYMTHDVVKPNVDFFRCRGCGTIYKSDKKNPTCPKGRERCAGTIQRATARYVG